MLHRIQWKFFLDNFKVFINIRSIMYFSLWIKLFSQLPHNYLNENNFVSLMSAYEIYLEDLAISMIRSQFYSNEFTDPFPPSDKTKHSELVFKLAQPVHGSKNNLSLFIGKDEAIQSQKYSQINQSKELFYLVLGRGVSETFFLIKFRVLNGH